MSLTDAQILELAYTEFEEKRYDEALQLFILTYSHGYQQEKIREILYDCYYAGNEQIFYESFVKTKGNHYCEFKKTSLDFFLYKDGEYYIYNKKTEIFEGLFSIPSLFKEEKQEYETLEFTPITLAFNGDWREVSSVLTDALAKKIYVICEDMERITSYFKVPELQSYMKNIKIFPNICEYQNYFHIHTNKSLPKIVFAEEKVAQIINQILEEEHKFRLTDQGRNETNILLSIGIPTHNRGNLLLKRLENLLQMPYDSEIEIVISKNGSTLYQEEYQKVEKIKDARLKYYGTNKELRPQENWINVVDKAHGKYVLFVSDEDDVVIGALEHYLNIIKNETEISLIRAKTKIQYSSLNYQRGSKGLEAFSKEFLGQNYLSGLIVRRQDFLNANMLKFEKYFENEFYKNYPHEWWCTELCKTGDYLADDVVLIDERDAVLDQEIDKYSEMGILKKEHYSDIATKLPIYATYEKRFEQFAGQVDFLKIYMQQDLNGIQIGLQIAIDKLAFLMNLARYYGYKKEQYLDMIDMFANLSMKAIDSFPFNEGQKIELLTKTKEACEYLIVEHNKFEINERIQEGAL